MQRRTNLFYTTGADSDFITFSNYAESLTGNFLATDWKMFPSKFICLQLPISTQAQKTAFVKNVVAYYENKLAFLRDYCIQNNKKVENYMHPLAWLIECLTKYFNTNYKISFVGGVSEHNYNGTYADTICAIDATVKAKTYKINIDNNILEPINYEFSKTYLYGWYDKSEAGVETWKGIAEYKDVKPAFDSDAEADKPFYYLGTNINSIEVDESAAPINKIEFNTIIPLFDLINKNPNTNENEPIEDNTLYFNVNPSENICNIPIGVWFANKNISLERDSNGYAPTWSLVLSSQFKPFPYSAGLTDEANQSQPNDAYGTFAHVLSRQNTIIDTFSKVSTDVNQLSQKLGEVEGKISTLATTYTIDSIKRDVINYKRQVDNVIENNSEAASTNISELNTRVDELSDYVYNIAEHLTDSINITQNGTYNVAAYGEAVVNVSNAGTGVINLSDVYTENISQLVFKNINADIYGNYRQIYFTLNCDKQTIWENQHDLHIALYKYKNRTKLKIKDSVGGTEAERYNIQHYRYTLQNDEVVIDDNLKLYCFVNKHNQTNPEYWNYYYISNEVNNNIDIMDPNVDIDTLVFYVHRNTTSTTTWNEPIVSANNYALLINNLVKYTGTVTISSLERASAYDINKYVKVKSKNTDITKDEKIQTIITNSVIKRSNIDTYTRYADDYRIVPTLLSECELLVTTNLMNLTNNKIVKRPGDTIMLNELSEEEFMNSKYFPKIIFIAPWSTYYIIMRYFKNDYCALKDRDRLQDNLRTTCKGMQSTKLVKYVGTTPKVKQYKWKISMPLEFSLLTTSELYNKERGKSNHIQRVLSFSKTKNDAYDIDTNIYKDNSKYSGIQKLI